MNEKKNLDSKNEKFLFEILDSKLSSFDDSLWVLSNNEIFKLVFE